MGDLKSCPFCGAVAYLVNHMHDQNYYVICEDCRAHQPPEKTASEAIYVWNQRHFDQDAIIKDLNEEAHGTEEGNYIEVEYVREILNKHLGEC